jgi:hypothetical protein
MNSFAIITADQRRAERHGAKILIAGPSGVGKTSLLRTLDPATTLFIDTEAGDIAVSDVPADAVRPATWAECRDWACVIGGPNPALPPTACYSEAHFRSACERIGPPDRFVKYRTFFVDSITEASRLSFFWCEQQPAAFSEKTGKPDLRSAYGLHGREMIAWLRQLQHARDAHVIFVVILEKAIDDFNHTEWQLQIEGSKTGRELPGIVDQIITMQFIDFGDGKPVRAFVCTAPNAWGYPGKDRSGRLEQIEQPHLGKLITRLTAHSLAADAATTKE